MRGRSTTLLRMNGEGSRAGSEYTLLRLHYSADIYLVREVQTSETGYQDISEDAFPTASEALDYVAGEALAGKGGR